MNRSGCSACAARTSPQTAAAAGSVPSVAPRVTTVRRAAANRSSPSHSWTAVRTRAVAVRAAVAVSAPVTTGSSTTDGTSSRSAARAAVVAPTAAANRSASGPTAVNGPSAVAAVSSAATHSTVNRESRWAPSPPSWAAEIGRVTSEATSATGVPARSATAMARVPSSARESRSRTVEAPTARTATPFQENGTLPPDPSPSPSPFPARAVAWSPASNSAGCRVNAPPSVPSGRAASANTSPSRRQAARRPWKTGP